MFREIAVTDIAGIRVGHAQNVEAGTGCTVLTCEAGAVAGVDVRGGSPATRETDLLNPVNMVEKIHAVVLSGGSAFGLDAASGVAACLEERGVGFDVQVARVPIVCGASLFDLPVGSPKVRPDRDMGYTACRDAAALPPAQGNVGSGTGASVGKLFGMGRAMKGGFGHYGLEVEAIRVASVVAVNCLGDVLEPDTGTALAGLLDEGLGTILNTEAEMCRRYAETGSLFSGNTTIGVVVTNGCLSKPQAAKAASMAHDGFARAMRPAHSMWDGDTIFLLATGEVKVDVNVVGILGARDHGPRHRQCCSARGACLRAACCTVSEGTEKFEGEKVLERRFGDEAGPESLKDSGPAETSLLYIAEDTWVERAWMP